MSRLVLTSCLLTVLLVAGYTATKGSIYAKDNLVAWCIVPFDAAKRGPEARAEMLADIGVRRLAYDWREKDIPSFGAELDALAKHGVELTAFWFPFDLDPQNDPVAQQILKLIEERKVKTQLWIHLDGPALKQLESLSQAERVSLVAKPVAYLAKRAAATDSKVALYNHGGWYGEPENQIEVIRKVGLDNVGLVYNLHHAEEQISDFPRLFPLMKPYLIAFNVNDMRAGGPKILPVGGGDLELEIMRLVRDSGWKGPVGILDHRDELDARESLLDNVSGMKKVVRELGDTEALRTY
jgi:sugar phosphate isomerase/epimerase